MSSSPYRCPRKNAGWSCFSLDANYIPPIPCAPTHALLGEKRKKMRKGSWGAEMDPKMTALLRSTRMTRHRLQCPRLSTGLGQSKQQQAQETKGRRPERYRQGTPVSPGRQLRDCRLLAALRHTSRVLAPKALPREHFTCLSINIRMSNSLHLIYAQHLPCSYT